MFVLFVCRNIMFTTLIISSDSTGGMHGRTKYANTGIWTDYSRRK